MEISAKCSKCNCDFEVDNQGYIYCPQCGIKSSEPLKQKAKYTIDDTKPTKKSSVSKSGTEKKDSSSSTKKNTTKKKTEEPKVQQSTEKPRFQPSGDEKLDKKLKIAFQFLDNGDFYSLKGISSSLVVDYPNNFYAAYLCATAERVRVASRLKDQSAIIPQSELEHVHKLYASLDKKENCDKEMLVQAGKELRSFMILENDFYYRYKKYAIEKLEAKIYNKKFQNVYIDNPIEESKFARVWKDSAKNPLQNGDTYQLLYTITTNKAFISDMALGFRPIENKRPTENHDIRTRKSDLKGDTNPFTFPAKSDSKFVKIAFWVLTFFVVIYGMALYAIFINPEFAGADAWAKTTTAELITIVGCGLFVVAGWLFWIIYFFVRLFKREDLTQPESIPKIRLAGVITLIVSLIFVAWKAYALMLATIKPSELPDFNMSRTKIELLIFVILFAISVILLLVLGVIDRTRVKFHMQQKLVVKPKIVILGFLHTFESLAVMVVVVAGLITLLNGVKPELLSLVLESNATMVANIAKLALIIAASILGGCLMLDIILTYAKPIKKKEKLPKYEETDKYTQTHEDILSQEEDYTSIRTKTPAVILINRQKALDLLEKMRVKCSVDQSNLKSDWDSVLAEYKKTKPIIDNVAEDIINTIIKEAKVSIPKK